MLADERHRLFWTFLGVLLVVGAIVLASRQRPEPLVRRAWLTTTGGAIHHAPAVTGDRLVVASRNGRLDGIEPVGGGLVWQAQLPGIPTCDPVAAAGRAFIGVGDGRLLAFALADGKFAWSASPGGARVGSLITVGTTLIALTELNKLWAFDTLAGKLLWVRRPDRDLNGLSPLTAASFALTFDDGAVEAWSAAGKQLWAQPVAEVGVRWPTVEGGRLIVTDDAGTVHALAVDTGAEQANWRFPTPLVAPPATRARTAWAALADGTLMALTGPAGWQRELPAPAAGGPVLVDDRVALVTGRHLQVLDAATGEPVWGAALESEATAAPRVVGRNLYFVTWGGEVGALAFRLRHPGGP